MKVAFLVVLLALAVGVAVGAQSDELNGPVASVEVWVSTTEVSFNNTVEVWKSHKVTNYDAEGNIIEEVDYSASDNVVTRTVHKYDASCCRVESILYGSLGAIEHRIERECDSAGREVQVDVYDSNGRLTSRSFIEYEGRLMRERAYDANGRLTMAVDIETDDNGNTTRMVMYDEETGKSSSVIESAYTDAGKLLSTLMYGEDGKLAGEIRYEYAYKKDGMNEVTTSTLYIAGIPFKSTIEGIVTILDSYGNWTEKRTYKQEEKFGESQWSLTSVERRTIQYR